MKIKNIDLLYISVFLWSFSQAFFQESEMYKIIGNQAYEVYGFIWIFIKLLLLIKISMDLFCHFRLKDFFKILVVAILAVVSLYYSQSSFIEPIFWFICSGKNCELNKVLKYLFTAQVLSICIIIIVSLFGIIPIEPIMVRDDGTLRYSLGFIHPNTLAMRVFQAMLLYIVLMEKKLKYRHCAVMAIIILVVNLVTNSRTTTFLSLGVLVIVTYYIYTLKGKSYSNSLINKFLKYLKYIVIIIPLLCIYLAVYSDIDLASRIEQASIYYVYYGLTLFGQPLAIYKNDIEMLMQTGLYTLDMSYMYLLLGFGLIMFIVFIVAYYVMFRYYGKEKRIMYIIALLAFIIMGFAETSLIRTAYNFTQFFILKLIWKKRKNIHSHNQEYIKKSIVKPAK